MILGSHNTMTYLHPKYWWQYIFRFMAKCQKLDYKQQYNVGARYFDFRFIFKKINGHYTGPYFAHGLVEYKSPDIHEVLSWLNEQNEDVYARFVLERCDCVECINVFKNCCMEYEQKYSNIKFVDAKIKNKWDKVIYTFKNNLPYPLKDCYASCNTSSNKWKGILNMKNWSGLLIDDLWPWIYAKFHNKKNIQKYKDSDIILLIDFIKQNN